MSFQMKLLWLSPPPPLRQAANTKLAFIYIYIYTYDITLSPYTYDDNDYGNALDITKEYLKIKATTFWM